MKHRRSLPWILMFIKKKYSSKSFKNHYDYLKITPKATQSEIKSAYFQLSKLYHPDMNDSDDAREKFRNISEAYEVLGNHEKRKQYDRHLNITAPSTVVSEYPNFRDLNRNMNPEELQREAARVKAEFSRHNDRFVAHDMDTWTKEHYGRIFQDTMEKKYRREARKRAKEQKMKDTMEANNTEFSHFALMIIVIVSFVVFQTYITRSEELVTVNNEIKKKN